MFVEVNELKKFYRIYWLRIINWPVLDDKDGGNCCPVIIDRVGLSCDESNCCRWSLKPRIFGCVNAHFSHKDVSQSRQ